MNTPYLRERARQLPETAQRAYRRDYSRRRKSIVTAYLAWLFLGWHYLYFGKVGLQFAFWLTGGWLVVGWIIDFFRIPGMITAHNNALGLELLGQYSSLAQGAHPIGV